MGRPTSRAQEGFRTCISRTSNERMKKYWRLQHVRCARYCVKSCSIGYLETPGHRSRNASLNAKMLSSLQLNHHRTRCHASVVPASRTHLSLLFSFAMCDHGLTIPVRVYQRPPSWIVNREDRLMLADIVLALFFQRSGLCYT